MELCRAVLNTKHKYRLRTFVKFHLKIKHVFRTKEL